MGLFRQQEPLPLRSVQARVSSLMKRVARLEQELAQVRLNAITARELVAIAGQNGGSARIEKGELQDRIVALFDLAWTQATTPPIQTDPPGQSLWERAWVELRELLACLELRPEFPQGAFDPRVMKAVEVVPAESPEQDRTVSRVVVPAIVRDAPNGMVVVRHAAVVVADARVTVDDGQVQADQQQGE